jgi:hypothetical protein
MRTAGTVACANVTLVTITVTTSVTATPNAKTLTTLTTAGTTAWMSEEVNSQLKIMPLALANELDILFQINFGHNSSFFCCAINLNLNFLTFDAY